MQYELYVKIFFKISVILTLSRFKPLWYWWPIDDHYIYYFKSKILFMIIKLNIYWLKRLLVFGLCLVLIRKNRNSLNHCLSRVSQFVTNSFIYFNIHNFSLTQFEWFLINKLIIIRQNLNKKSPHAVRTYAIL